MATATTIQNLNDSTTTGLIGSSNRRQTERFKVNDVSGTYSPAVGDIVAFDLSQTADADKMLYIRPADGNNPGDQVFAGVVLTVDEKNSEVVCVVKGICEAKVDGTVAVVAGESLVLSSTPKKLVGYGAASILPIVAYAVDATSVDGVSTIRVL